MSVHKIRPEVVVDDFMASLWSQLTAPFWAAVGDDEFIFDGLDERTIAYLRDRLSQKPELRSTLARAAAYRRRNPTQKVRTDASQRLVYFVEACTSGLVKIGSALDPDSRLRTLQTGSPEVLRLIGTTVGGEDHERSLHSRFAHLRVRGEWFRPAPELMAVIGGEA